MVNALPDSFRTPRFLRWLNVVAVATSLATATGAILGNVFSPDNKEGFESAGVACALSTLVCGLVWARVVRMRRKTAPFGWLASVPLAALNAGLAFAMTTGGDSMNVFGAILLGATFGAIIWIPALVLTLVCFGVPIYLAQRSADRGPGSEDRGEQIVGIVATAWAVVATAIVALSSARDVRPSTTIFLSMLGVAAMVAGIASTTIATQRESKRRAFLRSVASEDIDGFRIEEIAGRPILVSVTRTAEAYRAALLAEPIAELDNHGDIKATLDSRSY